MYKFLDLLENLAEQEKLVQERKIRLAMHLTVRNHYERTDKSIWRRLTFEGYKALDVRHVHDWEFSTTA